MQRYLEPESGYRNETGYRFLKITHFYDYLRVIAVGSVVPFSMLGSMAAQGALVVPGGRIPDPNVAGAVGSLLDNANYWRSHDKPEYALTELNRVLQYAPNNPDVLVAAIEVAQDLNKYDAAKVYQATLARVAPNDPRVASLAAEHQRTPDEIRTLNEARGLMREGKGSEAAARFGGLLKNGVIPRSMAIEYYAALGSTPAGVDEANEKLGALAAQFPDDARLQLAFAQLLTLQEDTRSNSLLRLSELATNPAVEKAARQSWRQTLLWQGASERARTQLATYLQTNPTDTAIEAKRREFDAVLPDESAKTMLRGYNAIATDPAKAEQDFIAALALNPQNPDAMIMLAAMFRQQGRQAEAQVLINRALVVAPDRRAELLKSAGGEFSGPIPFGIREAVRVAILTNSKRYDDAEQLLSMQLTNRRSAGDTASTLVQLGSIQRLSGHLGAAEASYRQAQSLAPQNGVAVCGLADVLLMGGRDDEAAAFYTKAAVLFIDSKNAEGTRRVAMSRAMLLQNRASRTDLAGGSAIYQTALTANPKEMYARVAYARFLVQSNQVDQARAIIDAGIKLNGNDNRARRIASDFETELGDKGADTGSAKQPDPQVTATLASTSERQLQIQAEVRLATSTAMKRALSRTPSMPVAP